MIKFTNKKLEDIFYFIKQAAGKAASKQRLSEALASGPNLRGAKKSPVIKRSHALMLY